ncbi:hypothetical protein HZU83_08120 [Sphaerotilus montanus]|uniref:Uncharacterized protein n=1 Tax=Sphaerotilus montanus TaxID=522889 RepID=A0A7Y9R3F2_9BURK|nr:hypothetical protein [Sphaerotilus montanus]NYG34550.1 hypothetical protein [Sphaerotilus montanus]NZD56647.1 hypothetical protein [Sphaerotilus montanus]
MHNTDTQALAEALYQLLPADGSNLGNATLLRTLQATAEAQGQMITEEAFQAARQHLLDAGRAVKGKGRGGSTGRNVETRRDETRRDETRRDETRKI